MSTTFAPCPSISEGDASLAAELGIAWMACAGCGREFPVSAQNSCDFCFDALEIVYDFAAIRRYVSRATVAQGPHSLWRYADLLPVPKAGLPELGVGLTPLRNAPYLAAELGLGKLWLKDDSQNPSDGFKDRGVAVALTVARCLGVETVGRASTGYLVNHINLRSFYVEGLKTVAFEIAEQLGWRTPDAVVVPAASGCLLRKVAQGFDAFAKVGLVAEGTAPAVFGAQAEGDSTSVDAAMRQGPSDITPPVELDIGASSLAIGRSTHAESALNTARALGGTISASTETEILDAVGLLARTEGIFIGPAGGATIAVLEGFVREGHISPFEEVVAVITGTGAEDLNRWRARSQR